MNARTKGHKITEVCVGVRVVCECGWESSMHFADRAREKAKAEHRSHREAQHGDGK